MLYQLCKILFFVLGSILLFACAPPAIQTTALLPAKFHEASQSKDIAVLPFDGPSGRDFSYEIEGTLASISLDGRSYFNLIDRTKIENVLREQVFSKSGLIDDKTASKVGKLIGAKGIYTGRVNEAIATDSHSTQEREECAQRKITYDKDGNSHEGKCLRWRKYNVSCTQREAIFSFTPKLIDVETGRILYSNNITGRAGSFTCQDQGILLSRQDLIREAIKKAKISFKQDVAPFYVTFTIKLMDSKDGITEKAAEQKMDLGLDFAKNNRLDRACELWEEAKNLSPNCPSLIYNLAICAEARGDMETALNLYVKADRTLNKPDERITAGIMRTSARLKQQQMLQKQLNK